MNLMKTTELKPGMFAALVMDLPNCGGFEVMWQGTIDRVEAWDMWGTPSETHHTIYTTDYKTHTVHNSHNWLVREQ